MPWPWIILARLVVIAGGSRAALRQVDRGVYPRFSDRSRVEADKC